MVNPSLRLRELYLQRPSGDRSIRFAMVLMLGMLGAWSASSEGLKVMSVPDFLRSTYSDRDSLIFMKGVVSGLLAANARIDVKTHQPLFCIPDEMTMTVERARQTLEDFLRDRPQFKAWRSPSLALVIGRAFVVTFPCR